MKIYRKTVFSLLLAFKLAAIQASPLLAEEMTSQWDKVVVIGTKTEKTLLESHQAVSVLNSEDIEDSGAQDIQDALRKVPGVNIDGGPRSLGETINIRGLSDSRVQVRIDGARMNFLTGHKGRLFVDPDSVEQIEVLRGNGSALYGSDAIGGVINITTKDPSDMLDEDETFGIRSGFTYNSVNDGFRKSGSFFGKPIDEFEYLANYTHWQTGDEIELGDGTELGNSQQRGYESLGKFIYHPTESSDIAITYSMFEDDSTIPGNPSAIVASDNPLMERDTSRELLKLGYKNQSNEGLFGDFETNVYYQITEVRENKLTGSSRIDDRQTDTFGIELKNSNAFETGELPHILTYGIEYYKDQTESNQVTSSSSAPIGSFPNGDFSAGAIFIQDEISLFDETLTLIPGLRWDTFESKSSGNADNEDDQVSPKIGAVYKLTEDIRLFTNYGKGFRAPRLLELYQSGAHFFGNTFVANPNLVAEESTNLDAGIRGKWKGFDFESVYYHIDAEDFIESSVNIFAGTTTISNVNDVEIWGVENYLGYDFGNGFSTYATFEIAKGDNETDNTPLGSIMPKNGRWGLTYEHEEMGFRANVESSWADKKSDAPSDEVETAGYAVWDLKLSQKLPWFDNTKVHFGIENIGDKSYREHLSTINAPGRNFVAGFTTAFKW
jgi:hemoglobin/transferrin/lactoferrin receptor protein